MEKIIQVQIRLSHDYTYSSNGFWTVTSSNFISDYQFFGGSYRFHPRCGPKDQYPHINAHLAGGELVLAGSEDLKCGFLYALSSDMLRISCILVTNQVLSAIASHKTWKISLAGRLSVSRG
jgi:hypothetical protein